MAEIIQDFLVVALYRMLLCPSISLLVKCYTKRSCLSQHSKESFAGKSARLLWHYCAVQMQGFSIFLTAWQTHSNPQSLSLLIPSDKGEHKAREGCSVPYIPGQRLSLQTQTCQLTSPGLMSLRALRWSRKLLSGKDASALGMQLWLPAGVKEATREKTKRGGFHQTACWPELTVSLNWSDSTHNMNIICTYMSFEAEKVQSPHSSESLPFLQMEKRNHAYVRALLRSAHRIHNNSSNVIGPNVQHNIINTHS